MRLLYDSNGAPHVIDGNDLGVLSSALSLGPPFAGAEEASASVMNPEGGGVSAWPSADAAGHPAVAVREDFPDGAMQTALVAGGAGGEVAELAVGRSGLGDGLVAFRQGPIGDAAIVAAEDRRSAGAVHPHRAQRLDQAPQATISWRRRRARTVHCLRGRARRPCAADAAGRVRNAHRSPRPRRGHHRVQVLATDIDGQATLSARSTLGIDGEPPSVVIARRGRSGVSVRISDAYSGVEAKRGERQLRRRPRARGPHALSPPLRPRRRLPGRRQAFATALGNQGAVRELVSMR